MSAFSERDAGPEDDQIFRVECYAGHRADSEPRRLHIGQREVLVTEIIDRWIDPSHRYFKLRGDDGGVYLLRHGSVEDRWEMTLYDSIPVAHGFFGKRGASIVSERKARRRAIAGSIARSRNAAIGRDGRASRRKIHV
jgi:hypothetical protein